MQWVYELAEVYNARLLWILAAAQFVQKGFVIGYSVGGFDWLMAAGHVPNPTMQVYSSIGLLPFAMKLLIGMMGDAFPVGGYRKNPYIAPFTFLNIGGLIGIGLLRYIEISMRWLVVGLFCMILRSLLRNCSRRTSTRNGCALSPRRVPILSRSSGSLLYREACSPCARSRCC